MDGTAVAGVIAAKTSGAGIIAVVVIVAGSIGAGTVAVGIIAARSSGAYMETGVKGYIGDGAGSIGVGSGAVARSVEAFIDILACGFGSFHYTDHSTYLEVRCGLSAAQCSCWECWESSLESSEDVHEQAAAAGSDDVI